MAKKKVAKKKANKKSGGKTAVKKNAPKTHCFVFCDGKKAKNVKELAEAIEKIEDAVFSHHVTADRNDFCRWIHDVLGDKDLADELAPVKDRHHTKLVIYRHIVERLW